MKKIILCFLIGVFLAGAVFAVMPLHPAYAVERSEKKEAVDPNAPHPDFEYVQMDPLTLPIITTKGLTQQVSLLVSLEVKYGDVDAISVYKPRLVDAYLQDLYGAIGAGYALMQGGVIDIKQIKERLVGVTGKVLGPEHKVNDVLLQVVQQYNKM